MLIRLATAVLVGILCAPANVLAVQNTGGDAKSATDEQAAQGPSEKKSAKKADKKADKKDEQAEAAKGKKPKKSKKPKSDALAPDEDTDPDTVETGGKSGVRLEWKQHPRLQVGNIFRLDLESKFQEDMRGSYPNAPGLDCGDPLPRTCEFELHRNRLGVKGYLFKKIEYEVEREFTEQELTDKELLVGYTPKSQWKDVNINIAYVKNAQIQIGKFKIPFGLDELTGETHNDFIFRSQAANVLSPSRDIGAQVHGRFMKKSLSYWVGAFEHDGDNAKSKKIEGGDLTVAGRVTGTPFRRSKVPLLPHLTLGTAFTVSKLSDNSDIGTPNGFRGRTVITQDTFYESVYVKGRRYRWEGDADWALGPFGARAEFIQVLDNRLGQGIGNEDLPDARARAWYVTGTWVLTGEEKKRPIKPADDFLSHGIGAVELGARYEQIRFDSTDGSTGGLRAPRATTIFPEGEGSVTLGVNWTLNRFVKLQFNAIRAHLDDPARSPVPDTSGFWTRILRMQLVL